MQGNLNLFYLKSSLDHLYSTHRDVYKALARPPFEADEGDSKLHDCVANTDSNKFQDSFDGFEEYTTSVTGFIDDVIPTVTVCKYPNRKSWIIGTYSTTELKGRAAAFKERDSNPGVFKKSHYAL